MPILSPLYNRPNTIIERQRALQADHRPVWYRLPRSRLYVGTFQAGLAVAMVGTAWGCYALATGKGGE